MGTVDVWDIRAKMADDIHQDAEMLDGLLETLDEAILNAHEQPADAELAERICHVGRELLYALVESKTPDAWTPDREGRAVRLLRRACDATAKTDYAENCRGRDETFKRTLYRLRAKHAAMAPVRATLARLTHGD